MADLWRVTYMGDGVKPTAVGAFAKNVTAYTSEDFALSLAGQEGWIVADPNGHEVGARPPKIETKKHEKPEPKAEEKKPAEKHEPKAEEKKPAEKPAEKAEKK
jgi:hypothetical protein